MAEGILLCDLAIIQLSCKVSLLEKRSMNVVVYFEHNDLSNSGTDGFKVLRLWSNRNTTPLPLCTAPNYTPTGHWGAA